MQALSNSSGFVNNVQASISQDTLDQITQAMTMLVQNTTRDHEAVANLITTNTNVIAQLTTFNRALETINRRLNALDGNDNNNGNRNRSHNGNHNGQSGHSGGRNDTSYCHTHGRTLNLNHIIVTCNNRVEGRVETATLDNRKGGSNRYCGGNY